ncbi:hypothetical protein PMAYCL1PPCAC_00962, partial [Pristionchus mayeri]
RLILLSLALVAITAAASSTDKPKVTLSPAAVAYQKKSASLRRSFRKDEKALLKKYPKDVLLEVKAAQRAYAKAKVAALRKNEKKGTNVTVPPPKLSKAGADLFNKIAELKAENKKKWDDFVKSTDVKIKDEIKKFHHASKKGSAAKPRKGKTTKVPKN